MSNTKAQNPWDWDIRVRERNVRNGTLSEKEVEKFMGHLPDLESTTESFATAQPALGGDDEGGDE